LRLRQDKRKKKRESLPKYLPGQPQYAFTNRAHAGGMAQIANSVKGKLTTDER